ncbi:hypothetical protein PVAND_008128 [Polypedilum vanderplanki]|uniref:cAMP-dependent protein kinase catalytic subunit n=1 Tax=Polypedilum vanderplanki TaxID=319348 RepID=A0A9J6C998_POLVA|nr:hypothetical protein PVAND_008128 [Polypedilum vanderplanki]
MTENNSKSITIIKPKTSDDLKKVMTNLKTEFDLKYNNDEPSLSSDRLNEFQFLTILGQGAFGVVKLIKHNTTEKFYAVKIISKERIVKSKQIFHCINEKKILRSLNYPFVVYLEFSLKDNSYVYFCMPFVNGGEMFTHLRKAKKFEEELSKFYAAQVFMALDYIHNLGMIYRDLKPENIMIDYRGFIKVTDFGFCKPIKDRTYTLCGTPEYLAPEVIKNKGYGQSADWWSFGILIFEMSSGYSPFAVGHPDQMQLLERICIGKYRMSTSFGKELKSLISNILQIDLTRRFGNLKNGSEDIKTHPWFNDTDWVALYNQEIKPPFIPKLTGPGDYSQFDEYEDVKLKIAHTCVFEKEFADF